MRSKTNSKEGEVHVSVHVCGLFVPVTTRALVCLSLSRVGGVVCRGMCAYVWLGLCMCVRQRQRGVTVGRKAGGHQDVFCSITYTQSRNRAVTVTQSIQAFID